MVYMDLLRLIAGLAMWKKTKWGFTLGLLLCLTTMIIAPSVLPFGLVDPLFAVIILCPMLFAYFGNRRSNLSNGSIDT